jgi:hypothetical protein
MKTSHASNALLYTLQKLAPKSCMLLITYLQDPTLSSSGVEATPEVGATAPMFLILTVGD